jgi:hypothetical protein
MATMSKKRTALPDGFRQDFPHAKDCWAKDDPRHAVSLPRETIYRSRSGRSYAGHVGSTLWLPFGCNNTSCGAITLVRLDTLTDFICHAMGVGRMNHDAAR